MQQKPCVTLQIEEIFAHFKIVGKHGSFGIGFGLATGVERIEV
jgi:hypothetical protein